MTNSPILNDKENSTNCQIVILAARRHGSRMESELTKVIHEVGGGKPMLERVLYNALEVTKDIVLVYSAKLFKYLEPYKHICKFALQENPKGTAHAADKTIIVIYGDNSLITSNIIKELSQHLQQKRSSVITLAFIRENPGQYGRIVIDHNGEF